MRLAPVFFFVVAVILVSGNEAAVARGIFKDPAHPGKCVIDGLVLNAGQVARHPKRCERILCGQNGEAEIQSCGVVGLPPKKKFGDYKTPNADYPACCDRNIINA